MTDWKCCRDRTIADVTIYAFSGARGGKTIFRKSRTAFSCQLLTRERRSRPSMLKKYIGISKRPAFRFHLPTESSFEFFSTFLYRSQWIFPDNLRVVCVVSSLKPQTVTTKNLLCLPTTQLRESVFIRFPLRLIIQVLKILFKSP